MSAKDCDRHLLDWLGQNGFASYAGGLAKNGITTFDQFKTVTDVDGLMDSMKMHKIFRKKFANVFNEQFGNASNGGTVQPTPISTSLYTQPKPITTYTPAPTSTAKHKPTKPTSFTPSPQKPRSMHSPHPDNPYQGLTPQQIWKKKKEERDRLNANTKTITATATTQHNNTTCTKQKNQTQNEEEEKEERQRMQLKEEEEEARRKEEERQRMQLEEEKQREEEEARRKEEEEEQIKQREEQQQEEAKQKQKWMELEQRQREEDEARQKQLQQEKAKQKQKLMELEQIKKKEEIKLAQEKAKVEEEKRKLEQMKQMMEQQQQQIEQQRQLLEYEEQQKLKQLEIEAQKLKQKELMQQQENIRIERERIKLEQERQQKELKLKEEEIRIAKLRDETQQIFYEKEEKQMQPLHPANGDDGDDHIAPLKNTKTINITCVIDNEEESEDDSDEEDSDTDDDASYVSSQISAHSVDHDYNNVNSNSPMSPLVQHINSKKKRKKDKKKKKKRKKKKKKKKRKKRKKEKEKAVITDDNSYAMNALWDDETYTPRRHSTDSSDLSDDTAGLSSKKKKKKKKHARGRTTSISTSASTPKKKKNKHIRQTRSEDLQLSGYDFTKESNKSRPERQLASLAEFSSLKPSKALKHKRKRTGKKRKKPKTPRTGLAKIKDTDTSDAAVPIPSDTVMDEILGGVLVASPPNTSPSHSPRRSSPKHGRNSPRNGRSSPRNGRSSPKARKSSGNALKSFPFVEHMTDREVQQLAVMDKLDHRYSNGMYLSAQVIQKNGTKYKIRYQNNRNNELWSDYKYELYRFAKQHAMTLRPAHRMLDVNIGQGVDVNAKKFKKKGKRQGWRKGVLAKKDYKSGQVQVEYVSKGHKHHYWTHLDNVKEIAPYKSMTERKKRERKKQQQETHTKVETKHTNGTKENTEFTFDMKMSITDQMKAYTANTQLTESNDDKPSTSNGKTSTQTEQMNTEVDMNVSIAEQLGMKSSTNGTHSPQTFDMNVSISEQMKAFSAPQNEYKEFDMNMSIAEQMGLSNNHTASTEPEQPPQIKTHSPSKKEHTTNGSPQKGDVSPFTISDRMQAYTSALQPQNESKKHTQSGKRKKKQKQRPVEMELDYMNVYSWSNEEVIYWFNTMEHNHFAHDERYDALRDGLKQWDVKGKELWQINDVFLRMLHVNDAKDRALIIDNIQKSAPKPMVSNGTKKRGHRRQFSQEDMDLGIKKATQPLTKENELLQDEISKLQDANRKINSEHTQKVSELTQLQRVYERVQKQTKKPSKELQRARQENHDVNEQLHQLTLRLKQQEEELKSRNEDVAKMRKQMSAMNKEIHKKDEKIEALKTEKKQAITKLKQQLAKISTKYEKLNAEYSKQKEQMNDATKDSYYERQNGGGNVITPIDTNDIKEETPGTPSSVDSITGNEPYYEYEECDEIRTIIVDNGSESIKVGYGQRELTDSHKPQKKFHSIIGRPKYSSDKELLVGDEAFNKSSIFDITKVIQRGNVTDWELMEHVWNYTFYKKLGIPETEGLTNHNVLLTESILPPKQDREKSTQIMFETFDANAMLLENEACLSLYGVGKVTGTVLGIGYGVTYSTSIFEGNCIPKSVARIHCAGYDMTQCLKQILSKRYSSVLNKTKHYVMKDMKQKHCYVAQNFHASRKQKADSYKKYKLPDGQCIRIGNERFIACEQLFGGFMNLNGEAHDHRGSFNHNAGVQHMIWKSMNAVQDDDLKQELYRTGVVLSGGSTLFKGLANRLKTELYKVSSQEMNIVAPERRKYLAWIGGSILSSLPNYRENFITKSEYEEHGAAIVHRKCA
eukprot:1007503_1